MSRSAHSHVPDDTPKEHATPKNRSAVFYYVLLVVEMKTLTGLVLALLSVCLLLSLSSTFSVNAVVGRVYIRSDGSIDPPTPELTSSDNVTYSLIGNLSRSIVIERDNIMFDGGGYTLSGDGSNIGMELQGRKNVTITNVEIRGFYGGVQIYNFSSNNNVFGVRAINNSYTGIEVESAMNNNVTGNTIVDCMYGIALSGNALRNTVSNNFIDETEYYGIELLSTSDNLVKDNNVSDCWSTGIRLWLFSCNNTIAGNRVAYCRTGIEVSYSSTNNTVIQNNLSLNSKYGISIGWRIPESGPEWGGTANNSLVENNVTSNYVGIALIYSKNNTILRNNILNNSQSIHVDGSFVNFWDDGTMGNYWSDYSGTDADNDGIGDSPYVIDINNVDNYPLMQVFDPPDSSVRCDYEHVASLFGAKEQLMGGLVSKWMCIRNSVNGLPFDSQYNLVVRNPIFYVGCTEVINMRDIAQAIVNYNRMPTYS